MFVAVINLKRKSIFSYKLKHFSVILFKSLNLLIQITLVLFQIRR